MGVTEMRTVHAARGERLRQRVEVLSHLDRATAEELRDVVRTDTLTGALTRDYGMACADRSGYLTLIDLDGFKAVNDTYGHAAGDVVLATVAYRLARFGTLVRLGGDEFLLCTESAPDVAALDSAASAPVALDMHGRAVRVGLSAGTVRQADHPESVEAALAAADARMYAVKAARRGDRRERAR